MKTATLTFHAPNNNGSFLQAYALQRTLFKFNIENKIIHFYSKQQEEQYALFRKPKSKMDVIRNVVSLLHYSKMKQRFQRFEEMRNSFLKLTKRLKEEKYVYNELSQYDTLICGSDQIWNTNARDFSDVYLLPNVKKKKIAYAISCGSAINENKKDSLFKCAKDFEHISFREESTTELFKKHGAVNAVTVLDPTLLLNPEDYMSLKKNDCMVGEKYIFLYTINYNDQVLETVKKISKVTGLKVYAAFNGYSAVKCSKYGIKVIYDMSPDVFLSMIENASIVCSNSFHGVAFSILFHKEFYRINDVDNAGKRIKDDRIDNLLNSLNIGAVSIDKNMIFSKVKIDYKQVDERISVLRKKSLDYLLESLK